MDAALEVPAGGDSFAEFPTYEDFLNSQVGAKSSSSFIC